MNDPVRWGILGAASFAERITGAAIHGARGNVLAALATRAPEKAAGFAALAPGLRIHDSYEALLADPGIDAVYIPCPTAFTRNGPSAPSPRARPRSARSPWACLLPRSTG
jgi:predicted dehydrogenase